MKLEEASRFFTDLTGINVSNITTEKELTVFCKTHYFHTSQKMFTMPYFGRLIAELRENTIYTAEDILMIDFLIIKIDHRILIIGPYTTKDLTEVNITVLKERNGLDFSTLDYSAYRANYVLTKEEDIIHNLRILLKYCFKDTELIPVVALRNQEAPHAQSWEYSHKNFEAIVNERYRIEREFMQQVTDGDTPGAISSYRKLHNNVRFMGIIGGTLDGSRISSGITRATVRVAAMNAGLPPIVIDEISGKSSRRIMQCTSRDEMYQENEQMIRNFTQAIQRYKKKAYSPVVFAAISYLESHYADPVSVEESADHYGISVSSYINRFRKETGLTPNAFLNEVRMRKARQLLHSDIYTIQEVAEMVGIPDGNYFVKCFKKSTGLTPSAYRNNHVKSDENALK